MEIIKFIRSLEDLLYEVMTWLLFYPRTFWRVLVDPQAVAARALADLDDRAATRFAGLVSPPLFLMLTILCAHGVEIEIHDNVLALMGQSGFAQRVTAKETNLLIFRVIGNSIVPLVMAYGFVRRQGLEVDAITLRSPFYLQCFFSAPLVVTVAIATTLHRAGNDVAAGVMAGVGGAWYLGVQGVWFARRLAVDRSRGFAIALGLFAVSLVIVAVVGVVIFGLGRGAGLG